MTDRSNKTPNVCVIMLYPPSTLCHIINAKAADQLHRRHVFKLLVQTWPSIKNFWMRKSSMLSRDKC